MLCQLELGYYLLVLGLEGVAGSLSNWVGAQSVRVWVMCGGAGSWASTTVVLSTSTSSTIFCEDRIVTPLDTAITLSNSNG